MDAFNALNHATFWAGDQNINSTTFGTMSSMFYNPPRVMQFGAALQLLMTPFSIGWPARASIDLAQPYYPGMPHFPTHPSFLYSLTKLHGEYIGPAGHSSAADALALGSHVGTHIDALCHFSLDGKLHGGEAVAPLQSYSGGLEKLSIDTVAPILRRGVLLDIAGLEGVAALAEDFEIGPARLDAALAAQAVAIRPGDVVLLRTGWARYWDDRGALHLTGSLAGAGPGGGALAQRPPGFRRRLGHRAVREDAVRGAARARAPAGRAGHPHRRMFEPGRAG